MLLGYKLTDRDGYTRRDLEGETLWVVGSTVVPTGTGSAPCGPGVLHAYSSPEVAALANPIHANIYQPRCYRAELVGGEWQTDGLKRWTTSPLRVIKEVSLPVLTREERVAWAILLAPHPVTRELAIGWLSGRDRSAAAAWAAAATQAAWVAEVAEAAAWSARAAAWAEAAEAAEAASDQLAHEARLTPTLGIARSVLAGTLAAEAAWDARWEATREVTDG